MAEGEGPERYRRVLGGRYAIVSPAGVGGMATVFRAVSLGLDGYERTVALKQLLPWVATDRDSAVMFLEEARVVSELHHPHIVQVLDSFFDEAEGRHCLVMEWIEGIDLTRWIHSFASRGEATPWPLATGLAIEVLRALHAAHGRLDADGRPAPVFHRDVTPANVLIDVSGSAKLVDFGLARAMDRATITEPGVLKGKLAYMAPEYVGGARASARTEIFSVGVLLWEALAGRRLRDGKDAVRLYAQASQAVPPLDGVRRGLPAALVDTVMRAVSPDPEARFESAREMRRTLSAVLRDEGATSDAEDIALTVAQARSGVR